MAHKKVKRKEYKYFTKIVYDCVGNPVGIFKCPKPTTFCKQCQKPIRFIRSALTGYQIPVEPELVIINPEDSSGLQVDIMTASGNRYTGRKMDYGRLGFCYGFAVHMQNCPGCTK